MPFGLLNFIRHVGFLGSNRVLADIDRAFLVLSSPTAPTHHESSNKRHYINQIFQSQKRCLLHHLPILCVEAHSAHPILNPPSSFVRVWPSSVEPLIWVLGHVLPRGSLAFPLGDVVVGQVVDGVGLVGAGAHVNGTL